MDIKEESLGSKLHYEYDIDSAKKKTIEKFKFKRSWRNSKVRFVFL